MNTVFKVPCSHFKSTHSMSRENSGAVLVSEENLTSGPSEAQTGSMALVFKH